MNQFIKSFLILSIFQSLVVCPKIVAAQVTGPADAGRVEDRIKVIPPLNNTKSMPSLGGNVENQNAPVGSEQITFVLKDIQLNGGASLSPEAVKATYAEFLNKNVTLDKVWVIASRLTALLQNEGYFLSRVYVPQQEIDGGKIQLNVVEGYVSEISLDDKAKNNHFVSDWTKRIQNQKPLKIKDIESLLLRLNDLPGNNYRAVLELPQDKNAPEGATRLSILTVPKKIIARTSIDNYGSRYLGPVEITQQVSMSLLPNQKTDLTLLSAIPSSELKYGGFTHSIPLDYFWGMDISASLTSAHPGYTLKVQDIVNKSRNYGIGFTYHQVRQRDEDLSFRISYDARDVESKILSSFPLATDHIRMLRASANYQKQDSLGGYNLGDVTLSQGLSLFGASEAGDSNLSRSQAKPDVQKLEMSYSRIQPLPYDLSAVTSLSGQLASGPLYASEEFGFGGQNMGRAYDSSEITGDSGIAGSLELRYQGLPATYDVLVMPYAFYDIGKVWNRDTGQREPLSASSAGAGFRISSNIGLSANLGFAVPLTREIETPLTSHKNGPRYIFQLSYDF